MQFVSNISFASVLTNMANFSTSLDLYGDDLSFPILEDHSNEADTMTRAFNVRISPTTPVTPVVPRRSLFGNPIVPNTSGGVRQNPFTSRITRNDLPSSSISSTSHRPSLSDAFLAKHGIGDNVSMKKKRRFGKYCRYTNVRSAPKKKEFHLFYLGYRFTNDTDPRVSFLLSPLMNPVAQSLGAFQDVPTYDTYSNGKLAARSLILSRTVPQLRAKFHSADGSSNAKMHIDNYKLYHELLEPWQDTSHFVICFEHEAAKENDDDRKPGKFMLLVSSVVKNGPSVPKKKGDEPFYDFEHWSMPYPTVVSEHPNMLTLSDVQKWIAIHVLLK